MKHSKALLVYSNPSKGLGIPYGYSCVCSIVKQYCDAVLLFDTTFIDNDLIEQEYVKTVLSFNPDLVCFSINEFSWPYDNKLINITKGLINTVIIAGGIYVTAARTVVLENRDIDLLFIGESEYSLSLYLRGEELDRIPGICYRTDNGDIECTDVTIPEIDEDNYPLPAFDLFSISQVTRPYPSSMPVRKVGVVETTRGCPFKCTYCCNTVLHDIYKNCNNYHREKSIERVFLEIELQKALFNIDYVNFLDDTMLINRDRLRELMAIYQRRIKLPFLICTRPETVEEELVALLKHAGVHCVALGVECGSEDYRRKFLNRNITNKMIAEKFVLLRSYGIKTMSTNMIGLPFETKQDMVSTLRFNASLQVDYIGLSIFYPFYGTPLGDLAYKHNLVSKDIIKPNSFREHTVLNQPQLPPEYVNQFYAKFHARLSSIREKT